MQARSTRLTRTTFAGFALLPLFTLAFYRNADPAPDPVLPNTIARQDYASFDDQGRLIRPTGYREWIYVGTPHTPNDMNNGNAAFPEFHTVYIDPKSWEHYVQTGKFREGTILVKELISVGSKKAVSGNGYFMGEFIGLEATVKSKERFADEPGNWAYFSFGHEYPLAGTAKKFEAASCNSCHAAAAADDFVFTQYYPVLVAAKGSGMSPPDTAEPRYTEDGQLIRPEGYREWIFVGTPLTPNDMNDGNASFPEFHNVYIHPKAWAHYLRTGEFMDGTIMVKELVSVGSKQAVSGRGYFMGDFIGLEATVKSKTHHPDDPGNWAYFSYGHSYPLADKAKAFPAASCNACHAGAAAQDFVFTQYYPVLAAARGNGRQLDKVGAHEESHDGEACPRCRMGVRELDRAGRRATLATTATPAISLSEVPLDKVALHKYLREGTYKSWEAREGARHPTRGPHTKFGLPVRVFLDETLNASLAAGNDEHPAGSSAVKEMYTKDGKLEGWAVMVKTSRESNGGKGWFWYEITSTTNPAMPVRIGNGVPLCYGCHAVGQDYVLTGYPLLSSVRKRSH